MTKLDGEHRQADRRRFSVSNNQVIAALITGICTIAAAFIAGAYKGPAVGIGPTPRVTVTEKITVAPKPNGSPSILQPSSQSAASTIPILAPRNDPGFKPTWHGSLAVGADGVRITSFGVVQGTPQDWDIAYQPGGSAAGWQRSGSNGQFLWYWDGTGTPDPAFCSREYSENSGDAPQTAKLGDRYCYADSSGVIGYMQVTNTGSNGVTAATWLWNKSG
jgi:hypothetical protein